MSLFSRKRPPSEGDEAAPTADSTAIDLAAQSALDAEFPDVAVDDSDDIFPDPAPASVAVALATDSSALGPPRALFPGSFLGGEYEIKEVLSRGLFNFYLADAGGYGTHEWKLVGERLTVGQEAVAGPDDAFFPTATRFVQDDREYAVWEFENLKSLDDWNARPNDETYCQLLSALARGFAALESAGLKPDLPREGLFLSADGQLKAFTFFDAAESEPTGMTAVQQLAALSGRFAKTNLASGATLRLDDEFGSLPLSEEVKAFATSLADGEYATAADAATALDVLTPLHKTETAVLTDVGMERELNEDCGMLWKGTRTGHGQNFDLELLAVSDGMGGHEGGEVASQLTLSSLEAALAKRLELDFSNNAVVKTAVEEMLVEVNTAVVSLTENPPYASMRAKPGATLVCALRSGTRLFIGNVGDSRAYRWNKKTGLQRLTKDHSYVQDMVDKGAITDDEAWGHPDGSIITSHIGMMRGMKRDVFLRLLSAGDRVVLVSDGVVDTLRDIEIEQIMAAHDEARELCASLVNAANDAGGFDNITVAALICE